ncbi:hypothetical protein [Mesorhizobium sp.]|uniref:hypothetical protein n=1 Tax=Mesorhizobium sp. TaxID=1871066 RepID=UPI000FE4AD9B|nr:hypothetical protein [Mesorhizobium sp.]RWP64867.1 MAG: hypothetical protein EOR08_08105 [Mesorhizobium sp.]RWQ56519.1 MAG: hypothetical protein EOS82_03215 [Mesorhizobium sp.]
MAAPIDPRCGYCKEHEFQAPNLCEDCREKGLNEISLPIEAMVEAVAAALETADVGYGMSLVRLVDGVSTYELRYDDGETLEFGSTSEIYEHVGQKRRLAQATAAIAAVLSQQVLAKRDALPTVMESQPPAGEKIRSTQGNAMEAAPVTGQSPVGAASPCGLADPSYHDCENMKEVGGGIEGERYRCDVCGKGYFLDYEDMK